MLCYIKRVIAGIVSLILIAFLVYISILKFNYVIPILGYHRIEEVTPNEEKLSVAEEAFARQMEFLHKNNYNVVGLDKIIDYIKNNRKIPARTVAITFDDGYRDNFIYAFPILKKYNLPATIFVIVDYIDKYPDYLTWEQIKTLSDNSITIGSHTLTHRRLVETDDEELIREVKESKAILEKGIGKSVDFISYPFGAFDERVKEIVKDSGYKAAFATSPGRDFPDRDIYALKRVRISLSAKNLLIFTIKTSGYHTFMKEDRHVD